MKNVNEAAVISPTTEVLTLDNVILHFSVCWEICGRMLV